MIETEKTRMFAKFPFETQQKIIRELGLGEKNSVVLASMFDDENYAVITYEEVVWKQDGSVDRIAIRDIAQLNCAGSIVDERYKNKWCHYEDGKIIVADVPFQTALTPPHTIRQSSPIVFVKDFSGRFREFKVEPGPTIQILSAKIEDQRTFLKVWHG